MPLHQQLFRIADTPRPIPFTAATLRYLLIAHAAQVSPPINSNTFTIIEMLVKEYARCKP